MFLFLVRQLQCRKFLQYRSCELISNYVLIFGSTTLFTCVTSYSQLWIDFKLCSYFWFDNYLHWIYGLLIVVNWFQIMFLFLVRQLFLSVPVGLVSCELISNYVLIFGSTTEIFCSVDSLMLWIDFKLCSYFWFDNWIVNIYLKEYVVNWFQIMFLFLVRQLVAIF